MNERIKLLAEQAGLQLGTVLENYTTPVKTITVEQRKFAELIVRECAGLFPNVYVEIETDYGHTPVIASDYIKQHFGVEE